jgi:hypothetical protein
MKTYYLSLLLILLATISLGQSTNGAGANTYIAGRYLGFDASSAANPLLFRMNLITRMRLNGTQNATLNGVVNHNVSGYFGIGPNGYFDANTPWSMLHLEGPDNTGFGGNGWRRWMNTGLFMRENSDGMYVGMMAIPETLNRSDAIISWSDDNNPSNNVDKLRFIFTGNNDGNGGGSTNPLFAGSLYGYEFMRMQPFLGQLNSAGSPLGYIGIGPLFTETFSPQSRLHMNAEDNHPTYLQITTQTGTGMTAADGMRLGVQLLGGSTNGYLQWQENTPMIFQTDWDAVPGGTQNGERIRIHSTAAPGVPAATLMGAVSNVSRVAISYFGNAPVSQPRTLLHMGANNATVPGWMEYGAMTANATQAVFFGITPTAYSDPNRNVVGFWNNQLVFITNPGEAARFSHVTRNFGVGDFSPTGLGVDPTQRIDVDGNGRFRNVPANGGQSIVLGITQGGNPDDIILSRLEFPNDPTQVLLGDGTWGSLPPGGPGIVSADNALTINPLSNVQWGQINTGLGSLNGGELIHNTEIPMNGFNVSFPGMGTAGVNRFQIGAEVPVGSAAKFYVSNNVENNAVVANHDGSTIPLITQNTASIRGNATNFLNNNPTIFFQVSGVEGFSSNLNSMNSTGVNGVAGIAIRERVGVQGSSRQPQSTSVCSNFGGRFYGANAPNNYGVFAEATGNVMNGLTIGVLGRAIGTNQSALYAGYFDGDLVYTGATYQVSDIALKLNISSEFNVLNQVMLLNPVNYNMNTDAYSNMGLSQNLQHGFISQEVQDVFPELVQTIIHPAQYDSLGVEISPQMEFLGLNYNGFISLNTAAIIELNEKVIEQEAQINDLNARLATLENCLLGILPMLCQMNNTLVAPTPEALQQQMRSMIDVELRNELAIVLDQNVPNPFAETTVITFSIPESVSRAQIHFYDAAGNLIKSVEVTERGDGQLNVFGHDLSSGLYTYTLVADGQLIATKKMVKK